MSSEDKRPAPRRKLPNRAKSTDGRVKITRTPPGRTKSFDGGAPSSRSLMPKSNSVGGRSMRGLLATANSAKNIVAAGADKAVKAHSMLATKGPKARPGAVSVKSLSAKHINAGVKENRTAPLVRALSADKITTGSNRSKSRERTGTTSEPDGAKRRAGRRPDRDGRSLTPSDHKRSLTPGSGHNRKDRSRTPSGHGNRRNNKERVIKGKDEGLDYLAIA